MNFYAKLLLLAMFALCSSALNAQTYSQPESAVYDAQRDCYYISNVGISGVWDGQIITRKSDSSLEYLVTYNFLDPKGLCIVGDTLFVADVNTLYFIDLRTRHIAGSVELSTADSFLSDIEADDNGYIYVSDTYKSCIYRIKASSPTVYQRLDYLGQMASPNGLCFDKANNRMLIVTYHQNASIMAIDLETFQAIYVKPTFLDFLYGIARDKDGSYFISAWGMDSEHGAIYKFDKDFSESVVFATGFAGPSGICMDTVNNLLAIPIVGKNDVKFISLSSSIVAPSLAFPPDNSTGLGKLVTLKWTTVFGAPAYTFQLSESDSFDSIIEEINTADTAISIDAPKVASKYYWRVRANGLHSSSDWSDTWSFSTPNSVYTVPDLLLPKNGELYADKKPTFVWSKVSAGLYHFQLWENNNFKGSPAFEVKNMTDTTFVLPVNLIKLQTYYWRVMTFSGYVNSGWSELHSFKVDDFIPDVPILLSPANAELGVPPSVNFVWSKSNSDFYRIQISKLPNFSELVIDNIDIIDTTFFADLDWGTTYYWRVRAYTGSFGTWSATYSFSTMQNVSVRYENQNKIAISPNPASNELNIANNSEVIENIRIFEFSGKEVLSYSDLNVSEVKIDISALSSGEYMIFIDSKGTSILGKFIISR